MNNKFDLAEVEYILNSLKKKEELLQARLQKSHERINVIRNEIASQEILLYAENTINKDLETAMTRLRDDIVSYDNTRIILSIQVEQENNDVWTSEHELLLFYFKGKMQNMPKESRLYKYYQVAYEDFLEMKHSLPIGPGHFNLNFN